MAWSLAAIFSINSIASSGVFNLIFPPTEASRSYFGVNHGSGQELHSMIHYGFGGIKRSPPSPQRS